MLAFSAIDPVHMGCFAAPLLIAHLAMAIVAERAARERGRDSFVCVLATLIFGLPALIVTLLLPRTPEAEARHQADVELAMKVQRLADERAEAERVKQAAAAEDMAAQRRRHAAARAEAERRQAEYELERRAIEARAAIEERAWEDERRRERRAAAERARVVQAACPECGAHLLVHPTAPCRCGACGARLAAMRPDRT